MKNGEKIIIHGTGGTAQLTALALHDCGFAVELPDLPRKTKALAPKAEATTRDADPLHDADWQRVLALAPASQTCLEKLGVWQGLEQPTTAMTGMEVRRGPVLRAAFTDTLDLSPPTQETIAHIVSLPDLHRAIARRHAELKAASDAAGNIDDTALHIMTKRGQTGMAPAYLAHDYDSDALVCAVRCAQPHGGRARQIFLSDGPLALLPLASTADMALVWSLPRARAQALATVAAPVFLHELNRACAPYGPIQATGPRATQALHMHLAQNFTDTNRVFLGDAAHGLHPLAGQGFNITLRDIATLVECLVQGRRLGLSPRDATMLARYAQARRADAALSVALTHGLKGLFGNTVPGVGLLAGAGLEITDALLQERPQLHRALLAQADSGMAETPALMRR